MLTDCATFAIPSSVKIAELYCNPHQEIQLVVVVGVEEVVVVAVAEVEVLHVDIVQEVDGAAVTVHHVRQEIQLGSG